MCWIVCEHVTSCCMWWGHSGFIYTHIPYSKWTHCCKNTKTHAIVGKPVDTHTHSLFSVWVSKKKHTITLH